MNRTVEKNKTLLVDGPASVTVESGRVEVFGSTITGTSRIVIREGKRLPFAVLEKAILNISLGENSAIEEVDSNTIPSSWAKSAEELLNLQNRPSTALVLGTVDCGKTSFCTYIINRILGEKKAKVAILDGDLGQSDIGPPSTIAYTFVSKPMTDMFNLQARNAFFIGETSPGNAPEKMIEGFAHLKKEIMSQKPEFLVVNTDGWIEGECAIKHKLKLVEEMKPDMIFYIQRNDELTPILIGLGKFIKIAVEAPQMIKQRDLEERKTSRELGYKKYLGNPKVQSFSLSWLKVEGNEFLGLNKSYVKAREARRIYDLLGMKPLYLSESSEKINIIIGRRRWISSDRLSKVEEATRKKVVIARKGEEEGLLAGLYNAERKFLGIGVLQEVDYLRRAVKIYTAVSEEACILVLGKVKLDKNLKEMPSTQEDSTDFSSFKKLF